MPSPERSASFASLVLVSLLAAVPMIAGCGSDKSPPATSTAAAVPGPVDMHCSENGVEIKQAVGMCVSDTAAALSLDDGGADGATADAATDGGAGDDAGTDGGAVEEIAATLFNAEGDDDDCKFHVSWKSTAVKQNSGVTFTVTVTRRADGLPAIGADPQIEAYFNDHHPAPATITSTDELAGGTYVIGPIKFDLPGRWTVRFHFYETCSDEPADSPHGHVAFFVEVP